MPTKTQIIQAFQQMNLTLLEVMLDDKKIYQEATKEMFLSKLAELFEDFKAEGDTALLAYPGYCDSEECDNKGCRGTSFSGNKSSRTIAFIFEGTEDEVTDIFYCSLMCRDDKSADWESELWLQIYPDEKADWQPTLQESILLQKCNEAYDELIASGEVIIKDRYTFWLDKYKELYLSFERSPYNRCFQKFYNLYYNLKALLSHLNSDEEVIQALMNYELMEEANEKELLNWLVHYETLGDALISFPHHYYSKEEISYKPIRLAPKDSFTIDPSDYLNLFEFKIRFEKAYYQKLEQYNTGYGEDSEQFPTANEELKMSLKYHLKRRGLL